MDINKILFGPDCILVTTPCASRTVSFAIEFFQIDIFGPLIICMYSRDDPVVRSMTTLA